MADALNPAFSVEAFARSVGRSAVVLAQQPDFGQASLILFGWGVMYFVAGAPMLLLVGMAGLVTLGGTFAYHNSEHFARRIDGFMNPDIDPTTQVNPFV